MQVNGAPATKGQMMAMTCYCFVIGNAVNIAALIYGFNESTACKEDTNSVIISVGTYLIAGAFVIMASGLFSMTSHFLLFPPPDDNWGTISAPQRCVSAVIIIFELVWSIIGLVLHDQIDSACADSDTGEMLLAFAIIYVITAGCGCCGLVVMLSKGNSE